MSKHFALSFCCLVLLSATACGEEGDETLTAADTNSVGGDGVDVASTDEDSSVSIPLGGEGPHEVVREPEHGTIEIVDGTAVYTPDDDYNGDDDFSYRDADGNVRDVAITVAPVNDLPTAEPRTARTQVGRPVVIELSGEDIDGDKVRFVVVSEPENGTVTIDGNEATYTPNPGFSGTDTFEYASTDNSDTSEPARVTVFVTEGNPGEDQNSAPVAQDDSLTTAQGMPLAFTLMATDNDGDPLAFLVDSGPAEGTLSGEAPALVYAPPEDFVGQVTVEFTVSDGEFSDQGVVTIDVQDAQQAPVANPAQVTTAEDNEVVIELSGSDPDGDPLTFGIEVQPENGSLSGDPPNLQYTPDPDFNGQDRFVFSVDDGTDAAMASVVIEVTAVNDAPVAGSQNLTTPEDTELAITLTGSDVDGDGLSFTVTQQPGLGTLSGTAPNLTYAPGANVTGNDSFEFEVSDGTLTDRATISIQISEEADAPSAIAYTNNTFEDTPLNVVLEATDADTPSDELVFTVLTQPANGSLSGNAPNLTYTPNANFNGQDSFTFQVSDGQGTDTATATIDVVPDGVRTAQAATVATEEDQAVGVTLTASGSGDPVTFAIVSQPDNGALSGTIPSLTYSPNDNFNGTDSFVFEVNDAGTTTQATITLEVAPVNDRPVANDSSVDTNEDSAVAFTLSAGDPDGDSLRFRVLTQPNNGQLNCTGDACTYDPNDNFNGTDSFTFRAADAALTSDATVTINVAPVNDAPIAGSLELTTDEDEDLVLTLPGSDPDGDALTFTPRAPENGTLSCNGARCTYSPGNNFNGTDAFTYRLSDGREADAGDVRIRVRPVNDAPTANAQTLNISEDPANALAITLAGADVDGDSLNFAIIDDVDNGSLNCSAASCSYRPNANFNGTDGFTFRVSDGNESDDARVTINVAPVNDAPVARDTRVDSTEDPGTLDIRVQASDRDGDDLRFALQSGASNGTASCDNDRCSYRPNANFNGTDSFTFRVSDGQASDVGTVTIDLSPVNDAPVATDVRVDVAEGGNSGEIPFQGSDVDGDNLRFSLETRPAQGGVECGDSGCTYFASSTYVGEDSFTFRATDPDGLFDIGTITINVFNVNDAPVASDDTVRGCGNTLLSIDPATLTGNDSDEDGDRLRITGVSRSSENQGEVTLGRQVRYQPPTGFTGTDSFTYTVSDGNGGTDTGRVTVTLNERVWYVTAREANGDGSSERPFGQLDEALKMGSAEGDTVYAYNDEVFVQPFVNVPSDTRLLGEGTPLICDGVELRPVASPTILQADPQLTGDAFVNMGQNSDLGGVEVLANQAAEQYAVQLLNSVRNVQLFDMSTTGGLNGLYAEAGSSVTVSDSRFAKADGACVQFASNNDVTASATFTDVDIVECGGAGLQMQQRISLRYNGGTVTTVGTTGVLCAACGGNVLLNEVTVADVGNTEGGAAFYFFTMEGNFLRARLIDCVGDPVNDGASGLLAYSSAGRIELVVEGDRSSYTAENTAGANVINAQGSTLCFASSDARYGAIGDGNDIALAGQTAMQIEGMESRAQPVEDVLLSRGNQFGTSSFQGGFQPPVEATECRRPTFLTIIRPPILIPVEPAL